MQNFLLAVFVVKAAATANWDELKDKTCMLGVAAKPVPGAATVQTKLLESTVEECKSACVNFPGCEAVSLNVATGGKFSCFFRQQVSPDKCVDALGHTSTYVMTSSFEDHASTDCLLGIAAQTLQGTAEPVEMQTTVASCQEKCTATAGCEAAIVRDGGCYLRQSVDVGKCHSSTDATLYVLLASRQGGGLVQAWQMPSKVFDLESHLTGSWLCAAAGLLLMGTAAAVAWRVQQRRFPDSAEERLSTSLAEEASDEGI